MTISYGKYQELLSVQTQGIVDSMISSICIVHDLTDVEVLTWPMKRIKEEFSKIIDLVNIISNNKRFETTLECPFGTAHYKSIQEFTLGEYIDLEYFMKNQEYGKLLALVYRRKEGSEWDADTWEPWGGYSEKRKTAFDEIDADICITAINKTYELKKQFLSDWDFIFEKSDFNYEEELSKEELSEEEKKIILDERRKDELKSSLNFEILIHGITGGDKLKIEDALQLNIGLIFKFIAVDKHLRDNKIV